MQKSWPGQKHPWRRARARFRGKTLRNFLETVLVEKSEWQPCTKRFVVDVLAKRWFGICYGAYVACMDEASSSILGLKLFPFLEVVVLVFQNWIEPFSGVLLSGGLTSRRGPVLTLPVASLIRLLSHVFSNINHNEFRKLRLRDRSIYWLFGLYLLFFYWSNIKLWLCRHLKSMELS